MIKPPQTTLKNIASKTQSSSVEASAVDADGESLSPESFGWGTELPSSYELLRREGEIHEGRGTVLDELRKNFARLEDLHGQLHFLMQEVASIVRR